MKLGPSSEQNLVTEIAVLFTTSHMIWGKVFKNGPSEICGRQPLKNLKELTHSNFSKAVFHKFYLVHS